MKAKFLFKLLVLLVTLLNMQLASADTTKPLTLVLDWFTNPDHAPIYVAQQQGFFKQQGIEVNIINPADPSDGSKWVAAGKADLAVTYQPQLVIQVSQGLPLIRIATLIDNPLNCLAVSADSNIKKIADLKGKTIGYSSGAVDKATLNIMLEKNGLTINDIKLINVRYNLTQALLSGKVDAVTGIMRNFELIEMELVGKPARAFYVEENGMPSYDELVIVANHNHLHDSRLPKFVNALQQGAQYLKAHPENSWLQFAKNHPELNNELNHQAWAATIPYFSVAPANYDPVRYEKLALFLQQQSLIQCIPTLTNYVAKFQ